MKSPLVSIIMGSDSDLPVMEEAAKILAHFEIPYEISIVSAHRTPERLFDFAKYAHERGIKTIIAGAGGAAHLPGMVAAISPLPVIGVPVKSSNSIDGWDSILSILQMPGGVPVATVALNGAKNAGILAAQILSAGDNTLRDRIIRYKKELNEIVIEKVKRMETGSS
ncbi:MAG: 5-(carboxyamino)imidazole ribonucleotide mutase [Bacteroidetes bacterium]|jgi:5-(carboxyamino)imidazole ribonucleotide mutase|nr:5-(carboxyamino)imidazole ribonucleotide mutase [Bacteroidota bacterium]